jgi:hypothetical protein
VLIMYLWTMLFSGTVVWLSVAETPVWILAGVTLIAMLALLLMSMPRFRFWNRARPPGRAARRSGPPPVPASPSPAAAGSVTAEARPAPRAG